MSAAELSNQLNALSDSLKAANTLISRLANLHLQPGSEPLDVEGGVRIELTQEIHDTLKDLEEELGFLRQEAEDYKTETGPRRRQSLKDSEEARLSAKAARLSEELTHSRQRFRNAQVAAKFASEEAKRKEREALFESYRKQAEQLAASPEAANGTSPGSETDRLFAGHNRRAQQQKQLTKDEVLVNASSDVTAALRRTHNLLSTELSRSKFAQETFDESTQALKDLGEKYSDLDDILSKSRNLLGTLLRSQKSDTWYLETAFYILIATLCWLFFRRILYGPFFKLPLFLWHSLIFLLDWIVWRPLFFLLTASGVIISEPAGAASRSTISASSSSRKPLIVQPSADGGPPRFPGNIVENLRKAGVPAGAGGAGAKLSGDQVLEGTLSESIGKMAEESAKNDQQPQVQQEGQQVGKDGKELPRRGDGTILKERTEPPNPKKKQFEADVEDAKHERRKRDEL